MSEPRFRQRGQLTGNAGLFHVARELSRRGWNVILTIRNARGADLYAANDDETIVHPIQSKALSKRSDVPLGSSIGSLRSPWWVITMNAHADEPECYVLSLDEVTTLAVENIKEGKSSFWLPFKSFTRPEFKNAWHRLE
ncbi:hypothetical protein [Rhodovulum strictum]|uniref:hypothetical protein n=1 Tax=Rhodovulum strictum TaxID=58314 RepID=UPI001B8775BD|nr:hypothetical protein [Rhodovulum strictum]